MAEYGEALQMYFGNERLSIHSVMYPLKAFQFSDAVDSICPAAFCRFSEPSGWNSVEIIAGCLSAWIIIFHYQLLPLVRAGRAIKWVETAWKHPRRRRFCMPNRAGKPNLHTTGWDRLGGSKYGKTENRGWLRNNALTLPDKITPHQKWIRLLVKLIAQPDFIGPPSGLYSGCSGYLLRFPYILFGNWDHTEIVT